MEQQHKNSKDLFGCFAYLTFAQIREFLVHFINQLFFFILRLFYFLQFTNNCHFFIFTIFLSFLQFVSIAILSIVSIISHAMGWKCLNFVFKSEVTNFLCTKIKIFGLLRKGFHNKMWPDCVVYVCNTVSIPVLTTRKTLEGCSRAPSPASNFLLLLEKII